MPPRALPSTGGLPPRALPPTGGLPPSARSGLGGLSAHLRGAAAVGAAGLLAAAALSACSGGSDPGPKTVPPQEPTFVVTSTSFGANEVIPRRYACPPLGDNVSPALAFPVVPAGTRSFAVTVTDAGAGDFVHWTVVGIPAGSSVPEGSLPSGAVAGTTGAGTTGWFGPCPPDGEHRYTVTAYALDTTPALTPGFTIDDLVTATTGHVRGVATLTGRFGG